MTDHRPKLLELLDSALVADHGVAVRTNNVQLLRQKLYAVRRESERFSVLSLTPSPIDAESVLWIVKKDDKQETTD